MGDYSLETGEYVWRLTCECCGKEKNRVWGFISKDGDAHGVFYALLNVEDERPPACRTNTQRWTLVGRY